MSRRYEPIASIFKYSPSRRIAATEWVQIGVIYEKWVTVYWESDGYFHAGAYLRRAQQELPFVLDY